MPKITYNGVLLYQDVKMYKTMIIVTQKILRDSNYMRHVFHFSEIHSELTHIMVILVCTTNFLPTSLIIILNVLMSLKLV